MKSIINISDRIVTNEFDGTQHEFMMSAWAVSAISKRYGGFTKIDEALDENNPNIFDEIFWILTTFANAAILYRNIRLTQDDKLPIIDDDYFSVVSLLYEVSELKDLIFKCIEKSSSRDIESESDEGNE